MSFFFVCYATTLLQGDTIQDKTIQAATVKQYLLSASRLLPQANNHLYVDSDEVDCVDIILQALKDYESVSDRKRMISDAMVLWMIKHWKTKPKDSQARAILDWIILGRYTGFQWSKWCQTTQTKFERIEEWLGKDTKSFVAPDFEYKGNNETHLKGHPAGKLFESVDLCWQCQKNKDNGQKHTYRCDHDQPELCPVKEALNICNQAQSLQVPAHHPIGVFKAVTSKVCFLTDSMVEKFFRLAAQAAHNIKDRDDKLDKWATHSICITACNLLHH